MTIDPTAVLRDLVDFDTTNNGEKKPTDECSKYINMKMDDYGFHTELLESNGFYTSFGRSGQGTFKILYIAHYDVVPVGDGWESDPFSLKVDGDIAYGRGSCDDKGNIVSMLMMAERLIESDFPCTVMLAATGDEEIGGRNGAKFLREYLKKQGLFPNYVVVADGIKQQMIHRRRNALPAVFKVRSEQKRIRGTKETIRFTTDTFATGTRHSAYMRPGVDRHAFLAASRYLDLNPEVFVSEARGPFLKTNVVPDWVELDVVHPNETADEQQYDSALTNLLRALLAISQASFPTKPSDKGTVIWPNILSLKEDQWTLVCDIRAMTNDNESVKKAFEELLNGTVSLASLFVSPGVCYVDVNPDSHLIRAAKWALEKVGIRVHLTEGFGASDSRYFAGPDVELFDFGPMGDNLHGSNEWVSISSIADNAEFYHTLLEVLTREKSPV